MRTDILPGRLEKLTLKQLLPEELNSRWNNSRVYNLRVKGYPKNHFPNATNHDGDSALFTLDKYSEEELIGVGGYDSQLVMMRKAFPHCLHGLMVVKINTSTESHISQFPDSIRYSFYQIASKFAEFSQENALFPNIAWTSDAYTRDRKSGQSQLWYHMHLNTHTSTERDAILSGSIALKDIKNNESMRSYIDEFSVIASLVLKDYFTYYRVFNGLRIYSPFELDGLPNLGIVLPGDWNYLKTKEFDKIITKINDTIIDLFDQIKKKIYTGDSEKWQRPQISTWRINSEDFEWMSEETMTALNLFFDSTDNIIMTTRKNFFMDNPTSKLTSHLYPLAGPSYGINITYLPERGNLLLSVRPQLFSDSGAAGLHYAFGSTIKIVRGKDTYTEKELNEKQQFEQEFNSIVQGQMI